MSIPTITKENYIEIIKTHGINVVWNHILSNYNSIKNGISTIAKRLKYDITNIDDQYKEMLLVTRTKGELIITISSVSYYEQSVDIKSTTHHVIAFGRAKKRVKEIY